MIHIVSVICLTMIAAPAAPTIHITATTEDGSPLPSISVIQVELEQPYIAVRPLGETDNRGRFHLSFDDRLSTKDGERGYGVYRFVLTPKDRPWALSGLYVWHSDPAVSAAYLKSSFRSEDPSGASNWNYGQRRALAPGDAVEWTVALPNKRPVELVVQDDCGFRIRNTKFRVEVDLEALSHTGFGGSIPFGEFTTDDEGKFIIPDAGDFTYSFEILHEEYIAPQASAYTKVLQARLSDERVTILYHRLVNVPFTVIVTDTFNGRPIPGATISKVIQFPSTAQGGYIGKADRNGRFHTDALHPEHIGWISATADGYVQPDEEKIIPYDPNRREYTVSLTPESPAKGSE